MEYFEDGLLSTAVECTICGDIFRDVVETPCCGTLYCSECLLIWLKKTGTCPTCRLRIEHSKCVKNRAIQKMADSLPVVCSFGCGAHVTRGILKEHEKKCSFRKKAAPTPTSKISESERDSFSLRHPPVELVSCPYANYGCEEKMGSKKVLTHLSEYSNEHLALVCFHIAELREGTRILEEHINEFYSKVSQSNPLNQTEDADKRISKTKNFALELGLQVDASLRELDLLNDIETKGNPLTDSPVTSKKKLSLDPDPSNHSNTLTPLSSNTPSIQTPKTTPLTNDPEFVPTSTGPPEGMSIYSSKLLLDAGQVLQSFIQNCGETKRQDKINTLQLRITESEQRRAVVELSRVEAEARNALLEGTIRSLREEVRISHSGFVAMEQSVDDLRKIIETQERQLREFERMGYVTKEITINELSNEKKPFFTRLLQRFKCFHR